MLNVTDAFTTRTQDDVVALLLIPFTFTLRADLVPCVLFHTETVSDRVAND